MNGRFEQLSQTSQPETHSLTLAMASNSHSKSPRVEGNPSLHRKVVRLPGGGPTGKKEHAPSRLLVCLLAALCEQHFSATLSHSDWCILSEHGSKATEPNDHELKP